MRRVISFLGRRGLRHFVQTKGCVSRGNPPTRHWSHLAPTPLRSSELAILHPLYSCVVDHESYRGLFYLIVTIALAVSKKPRNVVGSNFHSPSPHR